MSATSDMQAGRIRLAFYGDDFTGSTDALEVLAFAGLACALFLKPPTPAMLQRFKQLDAIGIAGDSRGMTPQEMDASLPDVLQALSTLAPITHYKVCSTFDSSPAIGNIGRVIEIARQQVSMHPVPVVAGNPALGRFCVFGNLFARSGTDGKVYRIDRHPIMSVHPVTPMDEADLGLHLERQAALAIARFAFTELDKPRESIDESLATQMREPADAILFDASTAEHLTQIGRLLDTQAGRQGACFVVGSSGVEYALTQWWRQAGLPTQDTSGFDAFPGVDRVLAVSGSASTLTAMQIDAALDAGFADVPASARQLLDDAGWEKARDDIAARAADHLADGRSVMLHTARGPLDPRIEEMIAALTAQGMSRGEAKHEGGRTLGVRLGHVVRSILARTPVRRVLLSGGDTSSQVTQVLAPDALTIMARLAPGAPLCRMHASESPLDGIEVALKGGQMGDVHFFDRARRGNA